MRRLLLPAVLLLALPAAAQPAPERPPPPRDERSSPAAPVAIDVGALREHTRVLSSDAYEGREPGTPGEEKTVAYLAAEMAKAGLKPGNGASWYQEVPLVETRVDPATTLDFAGAGPIVRLAYSRDMMVASKRTGERVAVADAPVVFAGYGIHAPERGWDDYAGLDVRGKVVVVLVNDPDWRTPGTSGVFDGRAMTYYGRWTYKHDEAARRGAAAVLIVHQTEPAAYPWSVVQTSWTGPQIDAARADGGSSRPAFEGWITAARADELLRPAGGLAALEAAAARRGFKAVTLPWRMRASSPVAVRRYGSKNVIGILPGRHRPGEVVLHTAHWDHLGRCPADTGGDDICNGAVDNASGTAGLLALAAAHAKAGAPARSLVFLAVTAEESGLLGSEYYAANPVYPLADTVAVVNMDVLGLGGRTSDIVISGAGKSELEPMVTRLAARQSRRVEPEDHPERGYYYRSDHFSFAKAGVPALSARGGTDVRGKGRAAGQAAADEYTAKRYHQPSDEYDPAWDWSGAVEDLSLYYRVARELGDARVWPNWLPTAEFRAARDATRAGRPAMSPADPDDRRRRRERERRGPEDAPR